MAEREISGMGIFCDGCGEDVAPMEAYMRSQWVDGRQKALPGVWCLKCCSSLSDASETEGGA